jgi:radical SAM superfamily enzyme YgiQ (UPF0313 family)
MPIGIASLSAFIKERAPQVEVVVADLSITMRYEWMKANACAETETSFFKDTGELFFDPDAYLAAQSSVRTNVADLSDMDLYESVLFSCLSLHGNEILALSAAFPDQLIHCATIAELVKIRFPNVTVLLGGAALSIVDVDELLSAVSSIDVVFRGEGEEGLLSFVLGAPIETIRGFSYLRNGKSVHNETPLGIAAECLPPPDLAALPYHLYLNPHPVAPVTFSRGCRWRGCRFCSHNFSFAGYRTQSVETFVARLAVYSRDLRTRFFYFADQYIGADDLFQISKEILRQRLAVRFHVMGRPTADYTPEILHTAFEAGCRWISWGVESFSQDLLDICNKGTNAKTIVRVLTDTSEAKISNLAMMIFGLPLSTEHRFQETLDAASDIGEFVDAFTCSSFQLFENTAFFRRANDFGLVPEDRELLFSVSEKPVHSFRRAYSMMDETGKRMLPRALEETSKWKRWCLFVRGGEPFFESLPAEHYLLHAAHRLDR